MKVRIFTDGACSENPGPGGWAAVFNTADKCKTISGNEKMTTNNRMELRAVIEAYTKVLSKKPKTDVVYELYSDSAYVVNSINNGWIDKWQQNNWKTTKNDDVKNRDLWEQLAFLRNKTKSLGQREKKRFLPQRFSNALVGQTLLLDGIFPQLG